MRSKACKVETQMKEVTFKCELLKTISPKITEFCNLALYLTLLS